MFGGDELLKRCLRLAARSLSRSELPECHVLAGVSFILTAWSLLWMMACQDCYELSGDQEFVQEIFPSLKQTADAFLSHINSDGLLEIDAWNMLDWAGMDTPFKGVVTHQNGLLVKALRDTACLAELLGYPELAVQYRAKAEGIKKAINLYLWNDERKAFVDCLRKEEGQSKVISMQTQVILKLFDCIDSEKLLFIDPYFQNSPKDFIQMGSLFISFFKYELLGKNGNIQEILDDIRKEWGLCWIITPLPVGKPSSDFIRNDLPGVIVMPGLRLLVMSQENIY